MDNLKYNTEVEINAELRALEIECDTTTSEFIKSMMIINWWDRNRQNFEEIQQRSSPKCQRTDVGGIFAELIQKLATESAFLVAVV